MEKHSSIIFLLLVVIAVLISPTFGSEFVCKISKDDAEMACEMKTAGVNDTSLTSHLQEFVCKISKDDDSAEMKCTMKLGVNDTTLTFTVDKCNTPWVNVQLQTLSLSWKSSTSYGSPIYFLAPNNGSQDNLFHSRNDSFKLDLRVQLYKKKKDSILEVEMRYLDSRNNVLADKDSIHFAGRLAIECAGWQENLHIGIKIVIIGPILILLILLSIVLVMRCYRDRHSRRKAYKSYWRDPDQKRADKREADDLC